MLALFGLLSAMFAGLSVETATVEEPAVGRDGDEGDRSEQDPNGEDLLDWQDPADDPVSTDTPPEVPVDQVLAGGSDADSLFGEAGRDSVAGDDGGDLLGGRGGDDLLDGGNGDDHAWGGTGDDILLGGAGRDVLHGEDGADSLDGGAGDDSLVGGEGADLVAGGDGQDVLAGGAEGDRLAGGAGNDWLTGGYGDDSLAGGTGTDTLDGGNGDDRIWGDDDDDADFLNGGSGDDWLGVGAGDYAHGGTGADTFALTAWLDGGQIAQISDFAPDEDEIVVIYDAAVHPDPQLTLVSEPGSPDTTVLLDGLPVAQVANGAGLDLSTLRLVAADQLAA
jgi:Ca2+-binding RTX toxin-like protein